jgi:hypothetical protein
MVQAKTIMPWPAPAGERLYRDEREFVRFAES